jgi:serine/threonine-protein kinase
METADRSRAGSSTDRNAAMTAQRWERIEALLAGALEQSAAQRIAWLDAACGDDVDLRREIVSLLNELDEEPEYLETAPQWIVDAEPEAPSAAPPRVGSCTIVRALGRGGMGQVWLAEREAPGFRQQVAIKVLRRGLDTDDLISRFRAERQILARLNHPNIARLYDVGATADGLPYFIMEYVDGLPLLEFCDRQRLTITERLRLFETICDAVHHAHRSLIVHRDIKPGNILVTRDGTPKLLDFGIAKVLRADGDDAVTRVTHDHARLLTPEYSAPEQIRGDPVTTACDVYALGVLLYELLAGQHPYGDPRPKRAELERLVLDVEPRGPSSVLTGAQAEAIAAARRASTAQLQRHLSGDLDTIVLTALRKEPQARYASALNLSEDVARHRSGLPINARPATAWYHAGKFMARHRLPVAAVTGLILTLAAATASTLHQSRLLREQSALVTRERDKALEVQSFLLEMFGTTGPDQATGDTVTARQLLDRRAAILTTAYADDPETRAAMQTVLAEGYERLGLYDAAEPLARDALATRRARLGNRHADVAVSLNVLGWLMRQRGDVAAADSLLSEAVAVGRAVFPPDGDARLARALNDLGIVRFVRAHQQDAAELLHESIAMRRRTLGDQHIGVAITSSNLAVILNELGDHEGAVVMADSALAGFERNLGPDHQRTLTVLFNLAAFRGASGDHDGAARMHRELVERRKRLFGARHPAVALGMVMIANELRASRSFDEAIAVIDSALVIQRGVHGDRHPEIAQTLRVRGHVNASAGLHHEALANYRQAIAMLDQLGAQPPRIMLVLRSLEATSSAEVGDDAAAEHAWREAARIAVLTYGETHAATLDARLDLIEYLVDRGAHAEAVTQVADLERLIDGADPATDSLRIRVQAVRSALAAS